MGEGGFPYKKDWFACQKFWKEPLRGTKVLFCGRGLKIFFTPKSYQFENETSVIFFRLNILMAPAVDLLRLYTLLGRVVQKAGNTIHQACSKGGITLSTR